MLNDVSRARRSRTSVLGIDAAGAGRALAGRGAVDHPPRRRAGGRAGRGRRWAVPMIASTASSFTLEEIAEANGGRAALVPALLAARTRELAEQLRPPRRGGRLQGDRRHARHRRCSPGARATCSSPTCRSCSRSGSRTTSPTRSSARRSSARRRRTRKRPSGSSSACSPTRRSTWDDLEVPCARRRRCRSCSRACSTPTTPGSRARPGSTASSSPTTAAARSTAQIAALDALPGVVDAVGDDLTVLLDSGVRSGADVAKALALGADAVGLGRPYLWGLAVDGEEGVRDGAALPARRARPHARSDRPHPPRPARPRLRAEPAVACRLAARGGPPRGGGPPGCACRAGSGA